MEIRPTEINRPPHSSRTGHSEKSQKKESTPSTETNRSEAAPPVKLQEIASNKAFFAVDDAKNVVIRVVDEKGNLIKQIPPEEYIKMYEMMREGVEHLFQTEA